MKKTRRPRSNVNPSENTQQKPPPACIEKMRCLAKLRIKQEVLDYARTLLTQSKTTSNAMFAAVEGLGIHADSLGEWVVMRSPAYR